MEDLQVRQAVHATLDGICKSLDCPAMRINGVSDHVHVLAQQGRGTCQSDWIKEMKRQSSLFVKSRYPGLQGFGWQAGYGIFSVDPASLELVGRYIGGQELHHRDLSFQDEFRQILREHGIDFDERYMWS